MNGFHDRSARLWIDERCEDFAQFGHECFIRVWRHDPVRITPLQVDPNAAASVVAERPRTRPVDAAEADLETEPSVQAGKRTLHESLGPRTQSFRDFERPPPRARARRIRSMEVAELLQDPAEVFSRR